jgi:hypothetical protein
MRWVSEAKPQDGIFCMDLFFEGIENALTESIRSPGSSPSHH